MHIQRLVLNEHEAALRAGTTILAVCGDPEDSRDLGADAFNALFDRMAEAAGDVSSVQVTEAQREHAERTADAELANLWDVLARQIPAPVFDVFTVYGEVPAAGGRPTTTSFASQAEAAAFCEGVGEAVGWMKAEHVDDPYAVVMSNRGWLEIVSPSDFDSRFSEQELIAIYGRMPVVPGVRIGGGVFDDRQYLDMAMDVGEHGKMASLAFQTALRSEVERVTGRTNTAATGCVEWIEGQGDCQVFRLRWRTSFAPNAEAVEKIFGMVAAGLNAMLAAKERHGATSKARASAPGL